MMFVLHSSKTHGKELKPQIVKVEAVTKMAPYPPNGVSNQKQRFCPFALLRSYISRRKKFVNNSEPFFVFRDRTPVSSNNLRKILKRLLILNGLDASLYSGISLRGGRATDLAEQKISIESIRKLGHWKSSTVYTYLRT